MGLARKRSNLSAGQLGPGMLFAIGLPVDSGRLFEALYSAVKVKLLNKKNLHKLYALI